MTIGGGEALAAEVGIERDWCAPRRSRSGLER